MYVCVYVCTYETVPPTCRVSSSSAQLSSPKTSNLTWKRHDGNNHKNIDNNSEGKAAAAASEVCRLHMHALCKPQRVIALLIRPSSADSSHSVAATDSTGSLHNQFLLLGCIPGPFTYLKLFSAGVCVCCAVHRLLCTRNCSILHECVVF
jgi:hypothetical protein